MAEASALLIEERLDRSRARFTDAEYGRLGKLLYLQTSDELWRDHMSHVQSLILGTQLCGHNASGDLAAFTLTSYASYESLQDRIVDSFLPKLMAFPSALAGQAKPRTVELSEDVMRILV